MRASPVGLFPKIEEVLEKTKLQASVTHDTPDGIQSAQAAALAVHYFAYNLGNKADLGKFIEQHVPNNWSLPWNGKVGSKGWQSTKAAISVIVKAKSLSEVLLMGVALGGDVDTVCTIAMSAGVTSAVKLLVINPLACAILPKLSSLPLHTIGTLQNPSLASVVPAAPWYVTTILYPPLPTSRLKGK